MDEALASCCVDISGRPIWCSMAEFGDYRLGAWIPPWWRNSSGRFAMNAGLTLHISLLYGKNDHHKRKGKRSSRPLPTR